MRLSNRCDSFYGFNKMLSLKLKRKKVMNKLIMVMVIILNRKKDDGLKLFYSFKINGLKREIFFIIV